MPEVVLAEVLEPVQRSVAVDPTREYRVLGVRWYGEGLFVKATRAGFEIKATRLYEIREGDFVYNRLFAWKGSFAIAGPEHDGCFVSNEFPTFKVATSVDPRYLLYYFHQPNVWRSALERSSGSTTTSRNRLKEGNFLAMRVPVPEPRVQARIVRTLDEIGPRVARLRALQKTSQESASRLLDAAAVQELERVDAPLRRVSEFVELRGGGTPAKSNTEFWGGDVPWVSPKDMKQREIRGSALTITRSATKASAAKLIAPGAVLVVVRGMILARTVPVAVLRVPAAVNQDMKALVCDERLSPEYLVWALISRRRSLLDAVERSTHDTRRLATQALLDVAIPVPALEAQLRIAGRLDEIERKVEGLLWNQNDADRRAAAVMPSLLGQLIG